MPAHLVNFLFGATALVAAIPSLEARQDNPDSTCFVYDIDFVEGGSYFIDSNSTANFTTTVQQFDDCNNDSASILLMQQSTEVEWECSSVETVNLQGTNYYDLIVSDYRHVSIKLGD